MNQVDLELILYEFRKGFAAGASGKRGRTVATPAIQHWKAGFEAGRRAEDTATAGYRRVLHRISAPGVVVPASCERHADCDAADRIAQKKTGDNADHGPIPTR